jgi:hypothetical protein
LFPVGYWLHNEKPAQERKSGRVKMER